MAFLLLLCLALPLLSSAVTSTSSSVSAPVFAWSDHRSIGLQTQRAVDYRVLSPQTLWQKFGWATNSACNYPNEGDTKVDVILAFFGNELQSEDIAHDMNEKDSSVIKILNDFFSTSKYSLALPYVSIPAEGPRILNTWFSTIKNSCVMKPRIVILRTCLRQMFDPRKPLITEGFQIVDSVDDLTDFIHSRQDFSLTKSEIDIIIACPSLDIETDSEGSTLASILSTLRQSGTSNAVIYASDPDSAHSTYNDHGRSLALTTSNSTCDEICETVTGVYEGVIVAITLLIILISGLCCMMGIETPTRFESSQDS